MNTHSKNVTSVATLALVALAAGVFAVLLTASHAPAANGLPSALATYEPQLSTDYNLDLGSLAVGTTPQVSQSAAEATALEQFGLSVTSNVAAFAVSATDNAWRTPQPNGTMQLKIANRPVWVVLIPNYHVQANAGMGHSLPAGLTGTLAVLVDAQTGDYLMASVVYP